MLFPMFMPTAFPVMVQEKDTPRSRVKSRKIMVYFVPDSINTYDSSVFCKLAQRRKAESRKRKVCLQTSGINMALDYPFLNDSTSRSLIWRSKVLFIMRGLPGSGKSTIVRAIAQSYQRSVVCSADDYFFKDGVYKFDAACLSSAHESCQNKAKDSCNAGIPVVIVDNTNVRRWEMKFYLELASHRDYVVVPVQPKTAWRWNPVELAAKNKHGVDVETLKRKVSQFDEVIPYYYAWFINASASKQLTFISQCLMRECGEKFPAFTDRLLKQLHVSPEEYQQWLLLQSASPDGDWSSGLFKEYYTRGNKPGSILHCTAKFCAGGRAAGAKVYHAQAIVQNSIGKAFKLEISSICFSPRTVGARVRLTESQLQLFDKPEEKDWNGKQQRSSPGKSTRGAGAAAEEKDSSHGARSNSPSQSRRTRGGKKKGGKAKDDAEASACTESPVTSWPFRGLEAADTKPMANATARSAHITIGTARGFESRETNFDVLRLCDMEAGSVTIDADFVPVTGGRARYFGDGVCCVYFDSPLHVTTIFSGLY